MGPQSLIVLMTDFGTEHWHVAAMKGEILSRSPNATILDLSHKVPRQNIESAAFLLHCAVDSFPPQTIFCCVVDPGVGSDRGTLVGWIGDYGYVGPDNGLATPLLERADGEFSLFQIKSPMFKRDHVSRTFHGRDVFAPAAARLWLGDDPRMAGPRVTEPLQLPPNRGERNNGSISGQIMLIDHFGNAVLSIERSSFGDELQDRKFELRVGDMQLDHIVATYASSEKGDPMCYWGSAGYLEVAVNFGSASEEFNLKVGDAVTISLDS